MIPTSLVMVSFFRKIAVITGTLVLRPKDTLFFHTPRFFHHDFSTPTVLNQIEK